MKSIFLHRFRFKRLYLPSQNRYFMTKNKPRASQDRRTRLFSARKYFSVIQKPIKKSFNSSIDIIDSIHQTNINLNNIEVRETNSIYYNGSINYDDLGIPYALDISKLNNEKPITIFHEIGHLIDLVGVGTPGQFESRNPDGLFANILKTAFASPEIIKIKNIVISKIIHVDGKQIPLPPNTIRYLAYLIDPCEIVARSYAQYIVRKSNSKILVKMLQNRKKDNKFGEQWSEKSFEPLLSEWNNFLNSIGWHVKK